MTHNLVVNHTMNQVHVLETVIENILKVPEVPSREL